MTPELSVLICTIPTRSDSLSGLLYSLEEQVKDKPVEILYLGDNKKMTVGEKRNWLLTMAHGKYVCFVDDDDTISPNYISKILKAAADNSDCIVFDVEISENGGPYKRVIYDIGFSKDLNFEDHYERLPNHLMPIKAILLHDIAFPRVSTGEDFIYAVLLRDVLKSQTRINETLYYYDYNIKTSETPRR